MEATSPVSVSVQQIPQLILPKTFQERLRHFTHGENTYLTSHLKSSEKKALGQELKDRLMSSHGLDSMWGIPLLGNGDERGDVIRARDFKVHESLTMLLKCLAWRKEFVADVVFEEDLGAGRSSGFTYMHGYDKINTINN